MKKRSLIFLSLLVNVHVCFSQDSPNGSSYIRFGSGISTLFGLDAFNETLQNSGVSALPTIGGSGTISYVGLAEKWDINADFAGTSLNNRAEKPQTQINLNFYSIYFNVGYNLLSRESAARLSPFIGFGIPITQLIVTTHDSTITTAGLLNGAQNMYFEEASIPPVFLSGLRFYWFPRKFNNSFGIFSQASFSLLLKDYRWKIPDMPIQKVNNADLSIGLLFRMKKN